MPPCRRAGAALPGRFAETLDSCRPDDNLDIFFAEKNSPWRGLGRAPMPGRWRGRGLLEQGAQVGHGGVALALAREFEVYDMVVHSGGAIDLRI